MGQKWIPVLRFIGIGWYIAFAIVLGAFGGRWVGQKLGTEAFFTIAGLLLGLLVAFFGVYKMLGAIMKNGSENRGGK